MLTSTGLSLGILLLALVSKVLRHKKRQAAENLSWRVCVCVCVCVRTCTVKEWGRAEGEGGLIPVTAAASSLAD